MRVDLVMRGDPRLRHSVSVVGSLKLELLSAHCFPWNLSRWICERWWHWPARSAVPLVSRVATRWRAAIKCALLEWPVSTSGAYHRCCCHYSCCLLSSIAVVLFSTTHRNYLCNSISSTQATASAAAEIARGYIFATPIYYRIWQYPITQWYSICPSTIPPSQLSRIGPPHSSQPLKCSHSIPRIPNRRSPSILKR